MTKILGMGNALVDIMIKHNDDRILDDFGLPKGSMQLVDKVFSGKILEGTRSFARQQTSGGSAANTIHGLANLGISSGFLGTVGDDNFGDFFREDMEKNMINPILFHGKEETGRAVALVSPDSERTFATYLGAAIELSPSNLSSEIFKGFSYFHIEGYLVQNHELIKKAVSLAKENNLIVSLDLASYNVVEENLEFLQMLVEEYVDIVFANEEEAKAFTGKEPEEALDIISKSCDIVIIKIGEKGSLIKRGDEIYKIGIIDVISVDSTGAGDIYASGFLYGLVHELSLDRCGKIGSILAGKVIEVIGAKIAADGWSDIHSMIKGIN
ncbi:MAG: adenosine kinase [Bacteroidales bacterium]|nr:adenosine kinase [Bacteroidales bacterium]